MSLRMKSSKRRKATGNRLKGGLIPFITGQEMAMKRGSKETCFDSKTCGHGSLLEHTTTKILKTKTGAFKGG